MISDEEARAKALELLAGEHWGSDLIMIGRARSLVDLEEFSTIIKRTSVYSHEIYATKRLSRPEIDDALGSVGLPKPVRVLSGDHGDSYEYAFELKCVPPRLLYLGIRNPDP